MKSLLVSIVAFALVFQSGRSRRNKVSAAPDRRCLLPFFNALMSLRR